MAVEQSGSIIHIYSFLISFSIMADHRTLNVVLCAMQ